MILDEDECIAALRMALGPDYKVYKKTRKLAKGPCLYLTVKPVDSPSGEWWREVRKEIKSLWPDATLTSLGTDATFSTQRNF